MNSITKFQDDSPIILTELLIIIALQFLLDPTK